MTTPTPTQERGLADQALENLVHQFARPLDFLRELVQNAIDAGTPRVEVWTRFAPPSGGEDLGVLEIHVDDFGEGMDEAIIDSQLTRMFSSTKEDDLTKIGKFGIGFTSVFAIEPDAILLRTGRHGESWELLFHPDRSFDKVRVDGALVGTQVTLFKRMAADAVPAFVEESRFVLSYWCVHSDTPVLFGDRSAGEAAPAADRADADPFAAFSEALPGADQASVTRPLDLDADPVVTLQRDGVEVIVGHADHPRYGYYNGGLTLLSTDNPDALGDQARSLSHLAFKVKYDRLEHTLTRDNVLMDQHWRKAVQVLQEAADQLRADLVRRAMAAAAAGEPLDRWHDLLARECLATEVHHSAAFLTRPLLRDSSGQPMTLEDVAAVEERHGAALLAARDDTLNVALQARGVRLLPDVPATLRLLLSSFPPSLLWWSRKERFVRRVDEQYVLLEPVDEGRFTALEARLLEHTSRALVQVLHHRFPLRLATVSGRRDATELPLALLDPRADGVCRVDQPIDIDELPSLDVGLLVLRHHPAFQSSLAAVNADAPLGIYGLAQAVLHACGFRHPRRYKALMDFCVTDAAIEEGAP